MQLGLTSLYAFLDACSTSSWVLATVTDTVGASYRKPGAMMLIDANYATSGLVSGGCLEDDLKAHARGVFESGVATTVKYDLSEEESASLWGLGLGCGGSIDVLLERISKANDFGGLGAVRTRYFDGKPCRLDKIVVSPNPDRLGTFVIRDPLPRDAQDFSRSTSTHTSGETTLSVPVSPVNRLLVCGAGPDAIPLVTLASQLAWQVIVTDPRPAYLSERHFPDAYDLVLSAPEEVELDRLGVLQAAVIMTHNVERDATWLKRLLSRPLSYVGLLGPAARRDMLLEQAGCAHLPHLFGPAGLDIGAALPEEIALSIMAQIHATTTGKSGGHLSTETLDRTPGQMTPGTTLD